MHIRSRALTQLLFQEEEEEALNIRRDLQHTASNFQQAFQKKNLTNSCISFLIIVNQAELKLIHVEVMGFSLAILPDTWPSGHQSRRPGI